jgi:hypothetical protein
MKSDARFQTLLTAGAAREEITPPLEVGLLMSSVEGRWESFEGVRMPLFARALVLEGLSPTSPVDRAQRVAIVSLDLLALSGKAVGDFADFKARVSAAAHHVVAPDDIVLVCTHTHSAPESGAITELYRTAAFIEWATYLVGQIGKAIAAAAASLRPCRLAYGSAIEPGLGVHRRYKTTNGIMMSHPEPPAHTVLSREGATDDSVNVVSFRDDKDSLIAVLINATCHPVYEMCCPQVSPDYPGELSSKFEHEHPGGLALFLNGAAGNVNPKGVSAGPAAAQKHAERLSQAVNQVLENSTPVLSSQLLLRRRAFRLPTRLPDGMDVGQMLSTEVAGLRLGNAVCLFLPGEPFAETGLALRQASLFQFTAVAGFAEETIGYIPTDAAFADGGYETMFGPWSILAATSEGILQREAQKLLDELIVSEDDSLLADSKSAPHVLDRVRGKSVGAGDVYK